MINKLEAKQTSLYFFPLALFIFNLIAKLLFITDRDIGLDEPFSIYHAQFRFSEIVSQLETYNNPPLYELILHFWIKVFGISPFAVRMLPLIFACLSPVALFYFGKRFFSERTGIVSSLLLSLSYIPFYFAHDSRVYSLFLLLSISSMYFFMAILQESKRKPATIILFVLVSVLLIYGHYFGFFVLFFQGLYLLIYHRNYIIRFSILYVVILLLYFPHLYPMLTRMTDSVAHGTWLAPPNGIESLYNMLWSFSNFPFITVFCIILLMAALIKAVFYNKGSQKHKPNTLILTWFLVPFFGMFFISFMVPMYLTRYLIFALPAYYILLVICIDFVFKGPLINKLVMIGLVLSFAFTTELNPDKHQYIANPVKTIKRFKDPSTLVIVSPPDFRATFAYHYNPFFFASVSDGKEYHLLDSLMAEDNVRFFSTPMELSYVDLSKYKKIIYYGGGGDHADPGKLILAELNKRYVPYYFERFRTSHVLAFFITR